MFFIYSDSDTNNDSLYKSKKRSHAVHCVLFNIIILLFFSMTAFSQSALSQTFPPSINHFIVVIRDTKSMNQLSKKVEDSLLWILFYRNRLLHEDIPVFNLDKDELVLIFAGAGNYKRSCGTDSGSIDSYFILETFPKENTKIKERLHNLLNDDCRFSRKSFSNSVAINAVSHYLLEKINPDLSTYILIVADNFAPHNKSGGEADFQKNIAAARNYYNKAKKIKLQYQIAINYLGSLAGSFYNKKSNSIILSEHFEKEVSLKLRYRFYKVVMHNRKNTELEKNYAKLEDMFEKYKIRYADLQTNFAELNEINFKLEERNNVLDRSFQEYKTDHSLINYTLILFSGALSLGLVLLLYIINRIRKKHSEICIPDKTV